MIASQSPLSWDPPDWHPDLGDAKAEREHLRELALAVLSKIPGSTVDLVVPEPGLMLLQILASQGTRAEVYSLRDGKDGGKRRYGLFVAPGMPGEQESYANSVGQAVRILRQGLQAGPGASETVIRPKIIRTKRKGTTKGTGT